jgi:hypothetical protein
MAVTTQTYATTSTPTTAAAIATQIRSAFIDAGLMTDWHDSFTNSTREHRVLRIIYDGTKTYGTTFYWFVIEGANLYVNIASGWNTTTKQPTGTQYLDFVSTDATTVANHMLFKTMSSNITFSITRWTSGANGDFTWFLVRNSNTTFNFHISKAAPAAFIDLNKSLYHGLFWFQSSIAQRTASGRFSLFPTLTRRHHLGQAALRSFTTVSWFGAGTGGEPWAGQGNLANVLAPVGYHYAGNTSLDGNNVAFGYMGTALPVAFNNTNPAFTTDSTPITSGLLLSTYSTATLPTDFGLAPNYNDNTMAALDTFEVRSGGVVTSAWQIIDVRNASITPAGTVPSVMFLAQTT